MKPIVCVLFGFLLLIVACSEERSTGPLPTPALVEGDDVPPPSHGVFFNFNVQPDDDPRPVLQKLLVHDIKLSAAWHPCFATPCMAPGATNALVVKVVGSAKHIDDFEFVADPKHLLPNCGVDEFWKYQFE
jgi:hypothetical protein